MHVLSRVAGVRHDGFLVFFWRGQRLRCELPRLTHLALTCFLLEIGDIGFMFPARVELESTSTRFVRMREFAD